VEGGASSRIDMNTSVIRCLLIAVAATSLGACSQEQEDRAAQQSAQAIREGNQALRELSDKAREGTQRAKETAKEGAREAGALLADGAITAKVKAALIADPAVDAMRIDVDTQAAVVTLSGQLPDTAQSERAAQIARGVEGVKSVENRLQPRQEGKLPSDAAVQRGIGAA